MGRGKGGSAPGGEEHLLLNCGWEGSWSESESESQEGKRGLRHRCPLWPAGGTGAVLIFYPQTLNVTLEWHHEQGPAALDYVT